MTLKDLCGEHILSGVDIGTVCIGKTPYIRDENFSAGFMKFTLDGITYEAFEDPDDGYRSFLGVLSVSDKICKTNFPSVRVNCRCIDVENRCGRKIVEGGKDLLIMSDKENGLPILEIGTDYYDACYPVCVMSWIPENMEINRKG